MIQKLCISELFEIIPTHKHHTINNTEHTTNSTHFESLFQYPELKRIHYAQEKSCFVFISKHMEVINNLYWVNELQIASPAVNIKVRLYLLLISAQHKFGFFLYVSNIELMFYNMICG
jgi:hypothetical protein